MLSTLEQKRLFRRITSNFGWSVIGEAGTKGLFFLVTLHLAKALEVKHYGELSLIRSVVFYLWVVVDAGVNMYGSREVARNKKETRSIVDSLLSLRLAIGVPIYLLFAIFAFQWIPSGSLRSAYLLAGLYLPIRALYVEWAFRGLEKFLFIAFGNFATFFFMLLSTVMFVKSGEDLAGAAFLWAFSYLVGTILFHILLSISTGIRFRFRPDLRMWAAHLRESFHFTIAGGLATLNQILPVLFLGFFSDSYNTGLFSAPYEIVSSLIVAIGIFPMSLYPVLSDLHMRDLEGFRSLFKVYLGGSLVLGLILFIAGFFFAEQLILLLFGASYGESILIFRILMGMVFLFCLKSPFGIMVVSSGYQRYQTPPNLLGLILFVLSFFTLRYFWKVSYVMVSSIALVVSEIGITFFLIFLWNGRNERSR